MEPNWEENILLSGMEIAWRVLASMDSSLAQQIIEEMDISDDEVDILKERIEEWLEVSGCK